MARNPRTGATHPSAGGFTVPRPSELGGSSALTGVALEELMQLAGEDVPSSAPRARREDDRAIIDQLDLGRHKLNFDRRHLDVIAAARFRAHRFYFDSQASQRVGRFINDNWDLVIEQDEFARPPYEQTYVELDARALWDAQHHGVGLSSPTADTKVGFLFIGDRLYIMATGPAEQHLQPAMLGPLAVDINRPQSALPFPMIYRDNWLLGRQRMRENGQLVGIITYPVTEAWKRRFNVFTTLAAQHQLRPNWEEFSYLASGDVINAVTCLLLLNQPSKRITRVEQGHRRTFLRGKPIVYHAHTTVHINLEPHESSRTLFHGDRASPRAHDVRGHWVHSRRAASCPGPHRFEPLDLSGKKFECPACGTRRTWRAEFIRGDATRGWVTKTYEVAP